MNELVTEYDNEITQLEHDIKSLQERLYELRKKRANFLCPFTIGQRVKNKTGEVAIVTGIRAGWGGYEMVGRYLRKNGEPGKSVRELYSFGEWSAQEA